MKFLIWAKPSATMEPPQEQMTTLLRGFADSIRTQLSNHQLDCAYATGAQAGFGIADAASVEEVWERVYANPMAPFWDVEVTALADCIATAGIQIRAIEAMQATPA